MKRLAIIVGTFIGGGLVAKACVEATGNDHGTNMLIGFVWLGLLCWAIWGTEPKDKYL